MMTERRIWRLWVSVCCSLVLLQFVFTWMFADERREAAESLTISRLIQKQMTTALEALETRLTSIERQLRDDWTLLSAIPHDIQKVRRDLDRYATISKPEFEFRLMMDEKWRELERRLAEVKGTVLGLAAEVERAHEQP